MNPLWILSLILTLLLSIGCGKDDETGEEGEEGSDESADASGGENGSGGGSGEFDAASASGGSGGSNDGSGSGQAKAPAKKKPATPSIDRSKLPIGKQQVWSYQSGQNNDLLKIYSGKNISVVAKVFGKPDAWQAQNNGTVVYTYDKMQVRAGQNMEYSKVHFLIKPIPTEQGGGGMVQRVSIDPSSGKQLAAATPNPAGGGNTGGYPGGPGGYPGGGDPNAGSGEDNGNAPPPGYPGGGPGNSP